MIFDLLLTLDIWLLNRTRAAQLWCCEWLSLKQVWLERGLLAAYVLCSAAGDWKSRNLTHHVVVLYGLSSIMWWLLWLEYRRNDQDRLRNLLTGARMGLRVISTLQVLLFSASFLLPPARQQDICTLLLRLILPPLLYVMA